MAQKSNKSSKPLVQDYYWYSVVIGAVVISFSILLAIPATIMICFVGVDIAAHENVWYYGFLNLLSLVFLLFSALIGCLSGGLYKFPRLRIFFAVAVKNKKFILKKMN